LNEATRHALVKNFSQIVLHSVFTNDQLKDKFESKINSREEMINFFKFMLPDHWKYGEKEFLNAIKNLNYPITLWEGYDLFSIKKI